MKFLILQNIIPWPQTTAFVLNNSNCMKMPKYPVHIADSRFDLQCAFGTVPDDLGSKAWDNLDSSIPPSKRSTQALAASEA